MEKSEKYTLTAEGFDWAIEEFEMLAGILGDPEQYDAVAENLSILARDLGECENVPQELPVMLYELAAMFSEAYAYFSEIPDEEYDYDYDLRETDGFTWSMIEEINSLFSDLKDELKGGKSA